MSDPAAGSVLGTLEQRDHGVGELWKGESRAWGYEARGHEHVPLHASTSPSRMWSLRNLGTLCTSCWLPAFSPSPPGQHRHSQGLRFPSFSLPPSPPGRPGVVAR